MSKEIYLEPTDFQKEVDDYKNASLLVGEVKYTDPKDSNVLDGRDLISDCIDSMNQLVTKLIVVGTREVGNLQNIKSNWMHVDEESGSMLLSEALFGKK